MTIDPPLDPSRQTKALKFDFRDLSADATSKSLKKMPSAWKDYFGVHCGLSYYFGLAEALHNYKGMLGVNFNTLRGCEKAAHNFHRAEVTKSEDKPLREGPFAGPPFRFELDDIGTYFGGRYRPFTDMMPELIQQDTKVVFITTHLAPPTDTGLDKNKLYWQVRLLHEAFPEAKDIIRWQVGNEVQSEHFDPLGYRRLNQELGYQKYSYNSGQKLGFYINMYLAPALEAIQKASEDVYGDKRAITTFLGSTVGHYETWLFPILDAKFDTDQAPTLNGQEVWKHIRGVCPHYSLGGTGLDNLQKIVDQYVKTDKIDDIWITESYGWGGRGPVSIIEQGFNFLTWAAKNDFDANEARVIWWGADAEKAGGSGLSMVNTLGTFLANRDFHYMHQTDDAANIYVVADSDSRDLERFYVVVSPKFHGEHDTAEEAELDLKFDPRSTGARRIDLRTLEIDLPKGAAKKNWTARGVQYSAYIPPQETTVPVSVEDGKLKAEINRRIVEPYILFVGLRSKP